MLNYRDVILCAAFAFGLPLRAQIYGFAQGDALFDRSLTGGSLCAHDTVVDDPIGPAVEWSAGGATFDRQRNSIWITNGTVLQERSMDAFGVLCTQPPLFALKSTHVSGLTYDIGRNQLVQLETRDGTAALRFYGVGGAGGCLTSTGVCALQLPAGQRATDVAIDSRRDLLWIAVRSAPGPFLAVTTLRAYRRQDCQMVCSAVVLGHVDALCYRENDDRLLAATRTKMLQIHVQWSRSCPTVVIESECSDYFSDARGLRGFDYRLAHGIPASASCAGAEPGCSVCKPLLDPVGTPVVGNAAFAMRVSNAVPGGSVTMWIKPAPWAPTPFACGTLYTPPGSSIEVATNVPLMGALPCTGTSLVPQPLPLNYTLIGQHYVQAAVTCPGGGTSLTNATLLFVGSE
jgi:hypothetical protein